MPSHNIKESHLGSVLIRSLMTGPGLREKKLSESELTIAVKFSIDSGESAYKSCQSKENSGDMIKKTDVHSLNKSKKEHFRRFLDFMQINPPVVFSRPAKTRADTRITKITGTRITSDLSGLGWNRD